MMADKAITEAIKDALLYGHGFIRITSNKGLEVHHINQNEFEQIKELFDWIKTNMVKD